MSDQIQRELPFDLKKEAKQVFGKLEPRNLANLPLDEIGTFFMFFDGARKETDVSFVTFDVFHEKNLENVLIDNRLFPCKKLDSLIETIEILCDKELLSDIKQGLKEIEEGKLIPEEEFLKRHDLK